MITYLLKLGELTLKKENRHDFEYILRRNIKTMLGATTARIEPTNGRFYIRCNDDEQGIVEDALGHLLGIAGWAQTRCCEKTMPAVRDACVAEAHTLFDNGARTFKVEARRTDKRFPLDSYGIRTEAGDAILDAVPGLSVDVHNPDAMIEVEIREQAFIYGNSYKGLRGLPVGTAGRGLLLLSGGIDSPVAGYLMASRGMHLDAIYFHAYPYTSDEARQKVLTLAGIVARYNLGIKLWTVNFTPVQMRIKEGAPAPWMTVLLRMAMMDCASRLARWRGAKCLVTGESLSQVASQTVENITCTNSLSQVPVFRPLIGMDKDSIIKLAERIGTYQTSILPYQDCCVLFSPVHPVLRGRVEEATARYDRLCLSDLIAQALKESQIDKCGFSTTAAPGQSL
jgi:thiamine biosynthesis protein ThiI